MVNGVFGAAGYRASLDGDDQAAGHGDGQKKRAFGAGGKIGGSEEAEESEAGLEPIDRIVENGGKIYGAEPIPREMTGGMTRGMTTGDPGQKMTGYTTAEDADGGPDGTRVGRVGESDLYVTPELTFDLSPARPTLSPRERHNPAENEPPRIRALIGMYHFLRPADRAADFVKQAKYMEDYESEGAFDSSFHAFFPVYSDMTVRQLKGYFAWRTRVRHGDYPLTSSSTAFVYLYELINGIGANTAEDAYNRLKKFKKEYADRYDGILTGYLDQWMRDLVVAKNLDGKPLQEQFGADITADRVYAVLAHPEAAEAGQVAGAILDLSGAKTGRSPLNRQISATAGEKALQTVGPADGGTGDEEDAKTDDGPDASAAENLTLLDLALAASWRALLASHAMPKGFFRSRVAVWQMTPVTLFKRAIYADEDKADHPFETRRVPIDPVREYVRENGHWYLGCYKPVTGQKASLKSLVHEVDRLGREVWHTGRPLKPRGFQPVYSQVIVDALTRVRKALDRAEWEEAHPPVRVDLSKLTAIRQAAAGTQESLLTEEEREAEQENETSSESTASQNGAASQKSTTGPQSAVSREAGPPEDSTDSAVPEKVTPVSPPEPAGSSGPAESSGIDESTAVGEDLPRLTPDELFLLRSLVDGRNDWKKTLLARHALPSVLADAINDTLFDLVGDSVLETDENGDPALVEDYRQDVTDYLTRVTKVTDTEVTEKKGQTPND